ncbi:MAG TPA: DUF4328 domain-containing protein [Polyangia bacterium]
MNGYLSTRGRATALTVLAILQIVALGSAVIAWAVGAAALDHDMAAAAPAFTVAAVVGGLDFLLFMAATIVFFTWVYRAMANLAPLGSMSTRFSPAMAVWAYIIPFVNLVWGHTVMAVIWRESQPPTVTPEGVYTRSKTTLVNWWWGLYLAGSIIAMTAMFAHPVTVEDLTEFATKQILFELLRVVTLILFVLMIRGAQKRQDEQWRDLEGQRNVPKPTAEALR